MNMRFRAIQVFGGSLLAICASGVLAFADPSSPIETNPLAWLKDDLSCGQLTDQMKARYSPLGPFSGMPPKKKVEVRAAMDVICSPKFAHCDFGGCKRLPEATAPVAGFSTEPSSEALAQQKLNQMVSERERQLQQTIKKQASRELRSKLGWQKMAMKEGAVDVPRGPKARIITAPEEPVRKRERPPTEESKVPARDSNYDAAAGNAPPPSKSF